VSDSEIEILKRVLDARNEFELASKLGISRSAVSQWKARGAVPVRFRYLLNAEGEDAYRNALQQQIFRKPEYHYWLRAALVLARAAEGEGPRDLTPAQHEHLIVNLMALAMRVTRKDLALSRIRDEVTWERLMDRLQREHDAEIREMLGKLGG
jgi:hypothetical protein